MEVMFIAQAVGVLGLILSIIIYQVKTRKSILTYRIIASGVFAVHYALLGANTGAAMNVLSAIRTYIFKKRTDARWADNQLWLYGFLLSFVILSALIWEGPRTLLPFTGMTFGAIAFWSKSPKMIRLFSLVPPLAWFTYAWFVGSYPGMVTELFIFSSVIVGIFRFDVRQERVE